MKVCRRLTFNAAHRLFNAEWSDEKNLEVFGKCSNPNFHGHNYTIETWLDGPIDPETGYVVSTVTNARVLVKKDAKGVITESVLLIRDSTIKAALLNPNSLKAEDPFFNDLDHQSRPYNLCPPPLP